MDSRREYPVECDDGMAQVTQAIARCQYQVTMHHAVGMETTSICSVRQRHACLGVHTKNTGRMLLQYTKIWPYSRSRTRHPSTGINWLLLQLHCVRHTNQQIAATSASLVIITVAPKRNTYWNMYPTYCFRCDFSQRSTQPKQDHDNCTIEWPEGRGRAETASCACFFRLQYNRWLVVQDWWSTTLCDANMVARSSFAAVFKRNTFRFAKNLLH